MKIRITGTSEELMLAKDYYISLSQDRFIKSISISKPYKNRNSINQYRLYIDIEYITTIALKNLLLEGRKRNGKFVWISILLRVLQKSWVKRKPSKIFGDLSKL